MAELKIKEAELATSDLASYGIPPKQPDGPQLVKGQEPETLDNSEVSGKAEKKAEKARE